MKTNKDSIYNIFVISVNVIRCANTWNHTIMYIFVRQLNNFKLECVLSFEIMYAFKMKTHTQVYL